MRPTGTVPDWASSSTHPAGTDPWSGQPTKVSPGLAKIAAGFVAGEKLPAEWLNWFFHEMAKWVAYQDTIEVRNFTRNTTADFRTRANSNIMLYDSFNHRYFAAGTLPSDGQTPIVLSSGNGQTWDDDGYPVLAGAVRKQAQIAQFSTGKILGWTRKGGDSTFYLRNATTGVWSASVNQPVATAVNAVCAVPFGNNILIGGIGAAVARVWVVTASDAWTTVSLPGAIAAAVGMLAASTTNAVAINPDDGADHSVWSTSNGTTWAQTLSPFASKPTGLVWVAADSLFWVLCVDGQVYTSPTGASWTLVLTVPSVDFPGGFSDESPLGDTGCVAALGGVVLASCLKDDLPALAIGRAGGTVWDTILTPFVDVSAGDQPYADIVRVENRLALIRREGVVGDQENAFTYSMRVP